VAFAHFAFMRTAGSPAVLEYRRCLGVQRVAEGYSTQEVADFLGVDPSTVRRWLAAATTTVGSAAAGPGPGRPVKLTSTQEKIVLRWLSEPPSEYGFPTDLWSTPRRAQLIEQAFDTHFNPDYLGTWLRQRGYTPQKPRRVPRERDDKAIARWLDEDWPRIKRKARRRGASLLFLDESGLLMAPLLRRSWALRGHPPPSKHKAGHREKVSVAATFWLSPLRDQLRLTYDTLVNGYCSNVEVAAFLGAVVHALSDPVIVLWDGGTMHQGDPIRTLVEESQGRLAIELLPPHASSLMPVEFLWRWLKYGRLCNFTPQDANDLNDARVRELEAIWDNQGLLTSFFHQSDLPVPRALFT
jgi:transposase